MAKGIGASATWVSSPSHKIHLNRRVQLAAKAVAVQKEKDFEQRSQRYHARRDK